MRDTNTLERMIAVMGIGIGLSGVGYLLCQGSSSLNSKSGILNDSGSNLIPNFEVKGVLEKDGSHSQDAGTGSMEGQHSEENTQLVKHKQEISDQKAQFEEQIIQLLNEQMRLCIENSQLQKENVEPLKKTTQLLNEITQLYRLRRDF